MDDLLSWTRDPEVRAIEEKPPSASEVLDGMVEVRGDKARTATHGFAAVGS